ncbi:permease-like cell division protein FtsX [Calorimonas adulescens]|jgi:cell division protein FtsX|uniref:Cell division protein FtsX n=1 Tax=Calorimonas adulescens TaxID=2606906 RepID=A0A5D8QEX1_9THEO|nr:permease-like cell division protein FtsX [Calorimonas adulescens]TZE83115.1 ABC transporter permease [Calorimonas adulescens]
MSLNNLGYYIKEGFSNLWKNRVMTVASISSVIAALFMLGIFSAMILNVDSIASQIESQLEIRVFLKNDLKEEDTKILEDKIKAIDGVQDIKYESKEQALENFKKQLGDRSDLLAGLEGDNPMPSSFIIKTESPQVIEDVVAKVKGMDGVDQVRYGKDIVEKILNVTYVIRMVSLVLIVVLIIVAVVIIYNTIRIAVYARRREIVIMRYVGATDWFIRWPFIIEGAVLGFLGTAIAIVILRVSYGYTVEYLTSSLFVFGLLPVSMVIKNVVGMLFSIGLIIGILGSTLSIHRFLKA